MKRLTFVAAVAFLLLSQLAWPQASPPEFLTYQGHLTDNASPPNAITANVPMVFRLFATETGGGALYMEEQTVAVLGGIYTAKIGATASSGTLAAVFKGSSQIWLEVTINGETLSPRVQLGSSGFALNAGALAGRPAEQFLNTSSAAQTKAGDLTVSGILSGNGNGLTALNATNVASGILSLAYGGTGTTAFAAGSIVFSNGTALIQDNANLYWNTAGKYLGIGTNAPTQPLHVEAFGGAGDQNGVIYVHSAVDRCGLQVESADGITSTIPLIRAEVDNPLDKAFMVRTAGEQMGRYLVDGTGAITWGSGGNAARDTRLYRSGANALTLDNNAEGAASFTVRGGVNLATVSGSVGIGTATPADTLHIGGNGTVALTPRTSDPEPAAGVWKLYIFNGAGQSELRIRGPSGTINVIKGLTP